jgi:hypothetical protein
VLLEQSNTKGIKEGKKIEWYPFFMNRKTQYFQEASSSQLDL